MSVVVLAAAAASLLVSAPASVSAPPAAADRDASVARVLAASRQASLEGRWDDSERLLAGSIAGARASRLADLPPLLAERGRVLADRSSFGRRDPDRARRALTEAVDAARAAGDARSEADARQSLAQMRYGETFDAGDWAGVRAEFEELVAARERLGDRPGLSESYFYLGLTYEQDGRANDALPLYRRSLEISQAIGDRVMQSYAHRHIGGIEEERGDLDAAERDIALSLELRRQTRFLVTLPYAMLQMADFLERRRGRRDEARRLVEQAIDAAEEGRSSHALATARLELSRMLEESGKLSRSLRYAECAREAAVDFGDVAGIKTADDRIGKLRARIAER